MLWGSETHAGTAVTEGWFNIELGSVLSLIAFVDPPYYLELTAAGELLEPRQKLASVPMALRAAAADSGDGDWTIAGGTIYHMGGSVGVGTVVPNTLLHLRNDGDYGTVVTIENQDTGASSAERITFADENGEMAHVTCYDATNAFYPSTMLIANNRPDGRIMLKPEAASPVLIDEDGNVGVGVSSPASKLDVDGTVEMTGLKMTTNPSDGYVLTSDAAGNGTWQDVDSGGNGVLIDVHNEETQTTIGSSVTQFDDTRVSLTVPGPGYIICTSNVRVNLNHASACGGIWTSFHSMMVAPCPGNGVIPAN